jgi:hypothetical protein
VRAKIGDIFRVETEQGSRYFQYLGNDSTQLGGNIIAAFAGGVREADIDIASITELPIEFFAITTISLGLKMRLWSFVGSARAVQYSHVIFRDTNDYGTPDVLSSNDWWVWSPNAKSKHVGPLVGEYRKSYIGVLAAPINICDRLKTGKYSYFYPSPQGNDPYFE